MKSAIIKLLISVLIGALFVWLAMRGVNWAEVQRVFSNVDIGIVLAYFGVLCVIQFIRTLRWGVLLRPLGEVGFGRLFSASSVGIMALVLLPLRLGEFARPLLVAERGKIRVSAALATIVVERVIDSLVMALLLVVILFFLPATVNVPAEIHAWGWAVLALFVLLMAFLVVAYRHQEPTVAWFRKLLRFLPARILDRLTSILQSFIGGLQALPDARLVIEFMVWTLLYWGINGVGMMMVFKAFAGLSSLGLLESFTVLSLLCVGLMIPAGPGMIGNFHYFIKLGLSLFVAEDVLGSAGVAYAILLHAMQLGQQVLFGLPFLFSSHISMGRLLSVPRSVETDLEKGPGSGDGQVS